MSNPWAYHSPLRLTPAATIGPPPSGRVYVKGEFHLDSAAVLWVCATQGNPGVWEIVGTSAAVIGWGANVQDTATLIAVGVGNRSDKQCRLVESSGRIWRFDAQSTHPDGDNVLTPSDIVLPAAGRWHQLQPVSNGTLTRAAGVADAPQDIPHGLAAVPLYLTIEAVDDANAATGSSGQWQSGDVMMCARSENGLGAHHLDRALHVETTAGNGYRVTAGVATALSFSLAWTRIGSGVALTARWMAFG